MRKLLSEDIQRVAEEPNSVGASDLARWQAMAAKLESRIAAVRGLLDDFEPDDTYGAMMRMSMVDALEDDVD